MLIALYFRFLKLQRLEMILNNF